MLRQGQEEVLAFGPGAAPGLLAALGKEKNEDAADRFREALDSITAPAHTRLLAAEFDAKRVPTRLYVMRRVAELGTRGCARTRRRAGARQEMKADPKRKKKVTEELGYVAVLASTGSRPSACLPSRATRRTSAGMSLTPPAANRGRPGGGRPARRGAVGRAACGSASPRSACSRGRARGPRQGDRPRARRPGEQRQDRGDQRPAPHRRRRGADREALAFAAIEEKWKKRIGG